LNSKMEKERLSLKSRRRIGAELKARRGKAKLGDKEENRGAKAMGKDAGGKAQVRKERKGLNRGWRGPGSLQGLLLLSCS